MAALYSKIHIWGIRILMFVILLGCCAVYSEQLFDGIKTTKSFYFLIVLGLAFIYVSLHILLKKKSVTLPLSFPDIIILLYLLWVFIRLLTSQTGSILNIDFWILCGVVMWYFFSRIIFFKQKDISTYIFPLFILLGYFQLLFCILQLIGLISSFYPLFPVSGTFDNSSELCIFLTSLLPIICLQGLQADDTNSKGIFMRIICLFYIFCWFVIVCMLGSRTSLLSGIIGIGIFIGFRYDFAKYLRQRLTTPVRKVAFFVLGMFMFIGITFLLSQFKKESADGRLVIWKVSLTGICENPIFGHGFNAFQAKYGHFQAKYFQQNPDNESEIALADNMMFGMNDYIEIGFNYGFIGLFLYGLFWLSLFKRIRYESIVQDNMLLVSVCVLAIYLVSSGFYFTGRMLPVTIITFFFAAYVSKKGTIFKQMKINRIKPIFLIGLFICCFALFAIIRQINHYLKWELANQYSQYGYIAESVSEYENLFSDMKHNGQFLYFYAKVLYENKEYKKSLECLKKAEVLICRSDFYTLFGDVCFQLGEYHRAKQYYEYALQIVPNRFHPLYKLFQMYIHTGEKGKATQVAQTIVKKKIKIDSIELQKILRECKEYLRDNKQTSDKDNIFPIKKAEDEMPDFKFTLINNGFIQNSDFDDDKYVLISFFNSECDLCINEIQALTDSISFLKQCQILLVSSEDSTKIALFYQQYQVTDYPTIRVAYATENEIKKLFKVYVVPTLYVYHPDRRMIKYKPGPITVSDIIRYIK